MTTSKPQLVESDAASDVTPEAPYLGLRSFTEGVSQYGSSQKKRNIDIESSC